MLRFFGFRDVSLSSKRHRRSRNGRESSPKRGRSCSDDGGSAQGMPSDSSDANNYRQCRGITVEGPDAPNPVKSFRDTPFPESITQEMLKSGFLRPTPLQAQVWPIALNGCDLFALAQKGSGKKLAYMLPAIVHAQSQPKLSPSDGPIVLVLTTLLSHAREIHSHCAKFCGVSQIKSFCMHSSRSEYPLVHVPTGVEIFITTPGILQTEVEFGLTSLQRVTYLVVDCASEMLEPEVEPALRQIVSQIRVDCQKLFLSAEWPEKFETLDNRTRLFHRVQYKVVIGSPDFKPNLSIHQIVSRVTEHQKSKELIELVGDMMDGSRTLIFMHKRKCDKMAKALCAKGWLAFSFHEGKSESERDYFLSEFRAGRIHIITASDFHAPDLDAEDVKYVINYDFPGSLDEYVHRIGLLRTSGPKRIAHTFFTDANARFARELIRLLEISEQTVTLELAALGRDAPNPKGKIIIPPAISRKSRLVVRATSRECIFEMPHLGGIYVPVNNPKVLDAAIFTFEEVKLRKQLHFVRVSDACKKMNGSSGYETYFLILDAVEGGEVKACMTIVSRKKWGDNSKEIKVFGLVDGGELVKLFGTKEVWRSPACDILRLMLRPEI